MAELDAPSSLSDRWIQWVLRQHRLILLLAGVLTVVAGLLASRLQVNGDLRVLLPPDHPVLEGLERIESTFGTINSVNILAKGGTAEARHAFTDALEVQMEGHPLLRDVEHGLPSDFFIDNALFYLSDKEMDELDELVAAWSHYNVCTASPDVCVSEPDKEAPKKLRQFIQSKRDKAQERTGFRERYEREGVEAEVLLAHPYEPASQLLDAREITEQMRALVKEVYEREGAPWAGTGMEYNILGPYITKADEHRTILRDMVRSGLFAFVGVVLILYVLFGSSRAVLVLLVPLLSGVVWSLGATQLTLGRLNVMTSTISTVVMGVGIDAGIHFFSRAKRWRLQYDDGESIRRAFQGLVIPLLVASSTTIGAFSSMASSDFPAFREFGIIAATGVALCLLNMVTVLPALAYLVGIKKRQPRRALDEHGSITRLILARPGVLFAALVGLSVLGLQTARQVEFEYNGRKLQSDEARERTEADANIISGIFGKDIHGSVLVRPTLDAARETLEKVRKAHAERLAQGDSVVAELFGVPDLLPDPSLDMAARAERIEEFKEENEELIEELEERVEAAGTDKGSAADEGGGQGKEAPDEELSAADAKLLLRMLEAKPFTVEELPKVLLNKLRASDGSYGVFAYPAFDVADMRQGMVFMEETSVYLDQPDDEVFVGEVVVYAAMFQMLREEAPLVLGMASVLITVLVLWQLRSVLLTVMTLIPLGLSMWWMLVVMGLLDAELGLYMKFTLFNLPILPAILGIGVDNGVYLTDRIRRSPATNEGLATALQETGGAILAATATTAVGFAAFMVADSGGVRGIGSLAVLGIILAAMAALLVLPTLTSLVRRRRG